jgi:AcrR family transcriptional regulator
MNRAFRSTRLGSMPKDPRNSPQLSGRRAQAARNDELILGAAREVFIADPSAPISAVAERAGVGIGALYRRYESKEELMRVLCRLGLRDYIAVAERAAAIEDPWESFVALMEGLVEASVHSLTIRLAGRFTPSDDFAPLVQTAARLNEEILGRAKKASVVRRDLEVDDISLLLEQLAAIRVDDPTRTAQLRRRYLALQLHSLHGPASAELPGPPPQPEELAARWGPTQSPAGR